MAVVLPFFLKEDFVRKACKIVSPSPDFDNRYEIYFPGTSDFIVYEKRIRSWSIVVDVTIFKGGKDPIQLCKGHTVYSEIEDLFNVLYELKIHLDAQETKRILETGIAHARDIQSGNHK